MQRGGGHWDLADRTRLVFVGRTNNSKSVAGFQSSLRLSSVGYLSASSPRRCREPPAGRRAAVLGGANAPLRLVESDASREPVAALRRAPSRRRRRVLPARDDARHLTGNFTAAAAKDPSTRGMSPGRPRRRDADRSVGGAVAQAFAELVCPPDARSVQDARRPRQVSAAVGRTSSPPDQPVPRSSPQSVGALNQLSGAVPTLRCCVAEVPTATRDTNSVTKSDLIKIAAAAMVEMRTAIQQEFSPPVNVTRVRR